MSNCSCFLFISVVSGDIYLNMHSMINYSVKNQGINQKLPKRQRKTKKSEWLHPHSSSCSRSKTFFFITPLIRGGVGGFHLQCSTAVFSLQIWRFGCRPLAESGPVVGSAPPRLPPVSPLHAVSPWTLNKHTVLPALHFHLSFISLSLHSLPYHCISHTPSPPPLLFQANAVFFCENWYQEKDERLLRFPCLLIHYSTNWTSKDTKRTEQNRTEYMGGDNCNSTFRYKSIFINKLI